VPRPDDLPPPGLDERTVSRIPRRHIDDAVQEAWLAYLRGKNPNTAAARYVNRAQRHERRFECFSELDADQWIKLYEETPG
jgi:hypothetical protein